MAEIKRTCFISTQLIEYKERLDGLKTEYLEIKKIKRNPEIYVNDYFAECIRKIDLQREKIIDSVHAHSSILIDSIQQRQRECLKNMSHESSSTNTYLIKVVDETKNRLESVESMLSSLEITDEIIDELFFQKKANKRMFY
jgi:hypothetical protein